MKQIGFIGWRGMVGSVLIKTMLKENDFNNMKTTFFSTSQYGKPAPNIINLDTIIEDAYDLKKLSDMDIILTCQGSKYSKQILPLLRSKGWNGYWIDAASEYRMDQNSKIVLDPVNSNQIRQSLDTGVKNFIGGNCTVSLLILAIHGLLKSDLVKSVSSMSYQAVSGAGANAIKELIDQNKFMLRKENKNSNIFAQEEAYRQNIYTADFPMSEFLAPIAFNVIPFIDSPLDNGQSKEEWKAQAELNKILNNKNPILIDGICSRVPVLRAHSQALTIELKQDCSLDTLESMICSANKWVDFIENNPQDTAKYLTPLAVTDTLKIAVGRLKKTNISNKHIQLFTVGDQLLWGASEPLRRMLKICIDN